MSQPPRSKVYTSQFWFVCLSALFFFASFSMIIPELNDYITSLGGADRKGLIISLFTLSALVSRPFSGKLADLIGRVPIMMFGSIVCIICSFLYPLLTSVSGFLLLRLAHGFSTGFTPTGLTAYLADIIPANKRGEAMGLLGTAGSIGMALGPAIGSPIANCFSLDVMFYCSAAFALISISVLFGIKETLKTKTRFTLSYLKISRSEIFEPRVLLPCIIMVLTTYSYGAVLTVIPDFGDYVGIENKGFLFTILTIASLAVRLLAGKASDRFGRKEVLIVSTFFGMTGMTIVGIAILPIHLMIGIAFYGVAYGMTSPTLFAWATDLSDPNKRGKGLASLYIFMELGIGLGAIFSGWIYANDPIRFFTTFMMSGAFIALAFMFLIFLQVRKTP